MPNEGRTTLGAKYLEEHFRNIQQRITPARQFTLIGKTTTNSTNIFGTSSEKVLVSLGYFECHCLEYCSTRLIQRIHGAFLLAKQVNIKS